VSQDTGAEGATAPETLRQKNRDTTTSGKWHLAAPAEGITFSGDTDRGAIVWSSTKETILVNASLVPTAPAVLRGYSTYVRPSSRMRSVSLRKIALGASCSLTVAPTRAAGLYQVAVGSLKGDSGHMHWARRWSR
jgi:hypothetical protein